MTTMSGWVVLAAVLLASCVGNVGERTPGTLEEDPTSGVEQPDTQTPIDAEPRDGRPADDAADGGVDDAAVDPAQDAGVNDAVVDGGSLDASTPSDSGAPDALNPPNPPSACEVPSPVPQFLIRRLTRMEHDNSVRQVFGLNGSYALSTWPAEDITSGFENSLLGQAATAALIEQSMRSAESVATDVVANMARLVPCATNTSITVAACADRFITDYGRRLFRRPLRPAEKTHFSGVFTRALADLAAGTGRPARMREGIREIVIALLQDPSFLYRPELGRAQQGDEMVLTDHEVATRLAFLLTESTPDDALLDAADAGELETPAQIRAQAERLITSSVGHEALLRMYSQALHLQQMDGMMKSESVLEGFGPEVVSSLRQGVLRFLENILFEETGGGIRALLTSRDVFVNRWTAPLVGLDPAEFTDVLERRTLSEQPRAGLLTNPGLMAMLASDIETKPIQRGKFVMEAFLCYEPPPPPANLVIEVPLPDPTLTTRERYAEHRDNPACSYCHEVFDPPGFAFENFDAAGRYREEENGHPIDVSGEMIIGGLGSNQRVVFDGPTQLAGILESEPRVRSCFAEKWFTYAFARAPNSDSSDACTVEQLEHALPDANTSLLEMMLRVVETEAFARRDSFEIEACTP